MKNPNKITCPQCRASMRLWALDARRVKRSPCFESDPVKRDSLVRACLTAAKAFRDGPCFHQEAK